MNISNRVALLSCLCTVVFYTLLLAPNSVTAEERVAIPRIVNGLFTSEFATTGALLKGGNPDTAGAWCSGTLIGCRTFLTAAHCVEDAPNPNDYLIFLQHAGFFGVERIELRPDYRFPVADIAVMKLQEPVDAIPPTPINATQVVPFGTVGTIAGFGRSGGGNYDYLLKRYGHVVTNSCPPDVSDETSLCWWYQNPIGPAGDDSNTCNADSGGPLFVDLGDGEVVAGITSGGNTFDCMPTDISYDADVNVYSNWIQFKSGPDILNTQCGYGSQIDTATDVVGFVGELSGSNPSDVSVITVPDNTAALRVAMNGEDDGQNFNLYVKAGSSPTPTEFDCAAVGSGQLGYCEFDAPNAGQWFVLVDRVFGSGLYQVTATTIPDDALGLTVRVSSSVVTLPSGDPFPLDFTITNETGADATFDVKLAIHLPNGEPNGESIVLLDAPGIIMPDQASGSPSISLPLPPLPPDTTWGIGVSLLDTATKSTLSESYISFDVQQASDDQ